MATKIKIVSAILDTKELKLYKPDGTTIVIKQGDSRLQTILETITPQLTTKGHAELELTTPDNAYKEFEKTSKGAVRFFKIAKDKLKKILGKNTESEKLVADDSKAEIASMTKIIEEINSQAVPAVSEDFHEYDIVQQSNIVEEGTTPAITNHPTRPETIVAVTKDNEIIPGVELIKSQLSRASRMGSTVGVENFLKRIGSIIHERQHSVDDLLKFLERADLPIADDGCIVIYKVLNLHQDSSSKRIYRDCHTGKVHQWVGSYVCMDPKLVDHNRRNECSNGLHVARRGYISGFSGNVCVLAKLAPEDVIAVPSYDANKMRVCGYHILHELTSEQHTKLKSNRPLTDTEDGKKLLGNILAGNHINKTDRVEITGHNGANVVTTSLVSSAKVVKPVMAHTVKAEALNDEAALAAPSVNPKDVVKQVNQLSRKDKATKLFDQAQAAHKAKDNATRDTLIAELRLFKKTCKTGWENLGISHEALEQMATGASVKATQKPLEASPKAVPALGAMSAQQEIQKLLKRKLTKANAKAICAIKKRVKKSWESLGVKPEQADAIRAMANS